MKSGLTYSFIHETYKPAPIEQIRDHLLPVSHLLKQSLSRHSSWQPVWSHTVSPTLRPQYPTHRCSYKPTEVIVQTKPTELSTTAPVRPGHERDKFLGCFFGRFEDVGHFDTLHHLFHCPQLCLFLCYLHNSGTVSYSGKIGQNFRD